MKLKNKIHLWSTLLMLVILLIFTTIIYFSFSRLTYSTEVNQLQSDVNSLVETFNANPSEDPGTILLAYIPANGLIQVLGASGELIRTIQDPAVTAEFPVNLPDQRGTREVKGEMFAYVKAPIIWIDGEVATIVVAQSLREVTDNLQTLRLVLVTVTLLAMIPIVISSIVLGGIVTKPITSLTNTMTRIQRNGQFEKLPITQSSNDEIGQMGSTFNEMMALLEENYKKQEEFVSNASHELKTPLTVISSYAKLLQRQGMDDRKIAEEALAAIQGESERMKAMIEQFLHIARRSETQMAFAEVDLISVLEQTASSMNASFNREFHLMADDKSIPVITDLAKMKQLLYILLDNARKYSSERIEIIAKKDGAPIVQIRDYGMGIPKESLPFVFDRFYRVDKARSRETGGFGLGLSLAKQLADSLGVKLEIESIEGMGTTVSIVFSENFNVRGIQSNQEGS